MLRTLVTQWNIFSGGEWQCSVKLVESLPESEEERDKETSEGRSEAEKEDGEGDGFVAVTVCCEKGTTGPVVFETSEEHPFALATTEVFDNMVSQHCNFPDVLQKLPFVS